MYVIIFFFAIGTEFAGYEFYGEYATLEECMIDAYHMTLRASENSLISCEFEEFRDIWNKLEY